MNDREILRDGEAVIVDAGEIHGLMCCDCGLVHDIIASYNSQSRLVAIIFARREKATKKARRSLKRKKQGIWSEK